MCGRYTLSAGHEALARAFLAEFAEELKASWKSRYNIAPGGGIVAVLEDRDKGGRRAEVLHWGLVPHWAKDPDIGHRLINARAETVADKPAYRDAFRYRRCLIPASGFYEWNRRARPPQPYYFHPAGDLLLAFAGVWENWLHPGGSEILSAAIITTAADSAVGAIHHRMPLILPRESWDAWLDTSQSRPLMAPFIAAAGAELHAHAVDPAVNRTHRDDAALIEPARSAGGAGQLELF
jgi:putative SOS response-associated peptidase YedK